MAAVADAPICGRDQDFDIDPADYVVFSENLLTYVTALTLQQAALLGDMTADLKIDGRDFVSFRTAYDIENGAGAFQAMSAALPEPGAAAMLAPVAYLAAAYRRHRRLAAVIASNPIGR